MAKKDEQVAKRQPTSSERFTAAVMKEFKGNVGTVVIDDTHRRYIQGYFVALDNTLTTLEEKRLSKSEQYRDPVALSWENINLKKLSIDVVAYANMGLNPILPNHINLIPYKNKKTEQYDIGFIEGYAGKEIIAKRYALTPPDFAVTELVYAHDDFEVIKKDRNNQFEQYKFDVTNPFDRGEILGGFYYHVYKDEPIRNKCVVITYEEILKRKPDHAAPEFWGGEKDEWKSGKKTGKKIKVEGWHTEMCLKTLKRMCWNDIVVDGDKIDANYKRAKESSMETTDLKIENEIEEKAGKEELTIERKSETNLNVIDPTEGKFERPIMRSKQKEGDTTKVVEQKEADTTKVVEPQKPKSYSEFKKEEETKADGKGQTAAF